MNSLENLKELLEKANDDGYCWKKQMMMDIVRLLLTH